MENIIKQVMSNYNWSKDYSEKVLFEYVRFLQLRHKYGNVSPSDDIDKFWHQHLLNPKSYNIYCTVKFGEIVDHNPSDAIDQNKRQERIKNALDKYISEYGEIKFSSVWNLNIPYRTNINNSNTKQAKVSLLYTFDIYNKTGQFMEKRWKPNNFPFDKKVLLYNVTATDTIDTLKKSIQNKTNHNCSAIKIYANKDNMNKKLLDDTKLHDINTNLLYAVLEEMTSNGYC